MEVKHRKACQYPSCNTKTMNEFCAYHKTTVSRRLKAGLPPFELQRFTPKGGRNANWKGGISEYTNHYQMKKIRLEKMLSVNWKCAHCNKKATEVHHLDKTKTNHSLDNLIALCHKCHLSLYHSGKRHPYKNNKEYNSTYLKSLAKQESPVFV